MVPRVRNRQPKTICACGAKKKGSPRCRLFAYLPVLFVRAGLTHVRVTRARRWSTLRAPTAEAAPATPDRRTARQLAAGLSKHRSCSRLREDMPVRSVMRVFTADGCGAKTA